MTGGKFGEACFFIDGDAGEVAYFLVQAGEGIKKGAFSSVWITHQCDM
jgi:hypothetical protein